MTICLHFIGSVKLQMSMKFEEMVTKLKDKQMRGGEYELHLLIQASANLSLEGVSSIDAILSARVFGKTSYTKVKKGIGIEEVFWGEHFFFSETFETSAQISGQPLIIEVWDNNKILKDSLVGSYTINVKRIYSEDKHMLSHMWLALSNLSTDSSLIAGYIKISVIVVGEHDANVELVCEPFESITKAKKVLMPPNIQRKSYQVIAQIVQARDLRPADGDTVDSFIGIQFGQIYEKTEPIIKNNNPQYNFRLYIPLVLPSITDNIALRLCDYNYINKNQVMASYYININELLDQNNNPQKAKVHDKYHWIQMYGPPGDVNNPQKANVYRFFPQLASNHVGSILVRFTITPEVKPVLMKEQFKISQMPKPMSQCYIVTARVFAGLNLHNRNGRHRVMVRISGSAFSTTHAVSTKNGFCLWSVEKSFKYVHQGNAQMPYLFIYLIDEQDKNVGFIKKQLTADLFLVEDGWYALQCNKALVKYHSEESGFLKIGVSVAQRTGSEFFKEVPGDRNIVSRMDEVLQRKTLGKIVIELICAEGLIPLDEEGVSDPFFVFSYNFNEVKSAVKKETLNPIYFQKIVLSADVMENKDDQFPIIVRGYDWDKTGQELIGSFFLDVARAMKDKCVVYAGTEPVVPRWFELTNNGVVTGRFLASFTIYRDASVFVPREINIPFQKYSINMFILGLRNIKSNGLISVKRPFLEFDFCSLNASVIGSNDLYKNIKTEPMEQGPNINIKSSCKILLNLPADINYWPSLSCKVSDYVLGGIYEPVLGFFTLNLKDSYRRSQVLMNKILKQRNKNLLMNMIGVPSRLQGIHPKLITNLANFVKACISYRWKVVEPDLKLNVEGADEHFHEDTIVLLPNYKQSGDKVMVEQHREFIDGHEQYVAVGYDSKESRKAAKSGAKRWKHYRFALKDTYEGYYKKKYNLSLGIFDEIPIKRGRIYNADDTETWILKKFTQSDNVVGAYKGNCFISDWREKPTAEEEMFFQDSKNCLQSFMSDVKVYMFMYILQAFDLPTKDLNGKSDPYLIIKFGEDVVDLSGQFIAGTTNPQFNKLIKKALSFPRHSTIQIEVWDHDYLNPDDFIGSVVIDIENRVLSQLKTFNFNSPIELQRLRAPQSRLNQGGIRLWIDLVNPQHLQFYRELDISTKPPAEYELRIVVWQCENIYQESFDDVNDFYIECTFNDQTQSTDVHYRAQGGSGSFNWRMVFPIKYPIDDTTVSFRIYDRELLSRNQNVASGTFSIKEFLQEADEKEEIIFLYLGEENLGTYDQLPINSKEVNGQKVYDRFHVSMKSKIENEGEDEDIQQNGKLMVSMAIWPKSEAELKPVGLGREQPNLYPKLPEPSGRVLFSWNPLIMIGRLCGPKLKWKICCAFCVVLLIFIIYNILYSFGGGVLANLVSR